MGSKHRRQKPYGTSCGGLEQLWPKKPGAFGIIVQAHNGPAVLHWLIKVGECFSHPCPIHVVFTPMIRTTF